MLIRLRSAEAEGAAKNSVEAGGKASRQSKSGVIMAT